MCPHVHLPAATKRLHVSGCQNSSEHRPWEHGEHDSIHKDIGGWVYVFIFRVLKDQWIRAKYERREFTGESNHQQLYCSGLYVELQYL